MSQQIEPPFEALKPRELEILRLIAAGRSNQEIAQQLMIEVTTVRWHNRQIYSKLDVHSRTLLIVRARELGYLDAGTPPASTSTAIASGSQQPPQSNFPAQTTSFIGRQREISTARQLLATTRLLTMTGPGGTGKTRLALELARVVSGEYADGLCFIPLASVREPRLLPTTIAGLLKVAERATEAIDVSVVNHLADKQMLLVIDNFEHLISAAPFLATLLAAAPRLKIIVTSREVLRLYGEQEYPVPPLTMPDREMSYSSQELMSFEAVRLFLARAQAGQPAFQATNTNVEAIAEICARLDGLPLAIELAAARIKVLGAQQLLARLAGGLGTLGQGPRDAPARQRTLRATIDWSYNLLSEEEKALLSQVSVFQGGWNLEAMEAICAIYAPVDLFEVLNGLIDKSLVQTVDDFQDESRFKLLETVRDYALEQLPPDEAGAIHRRHRDFFLQLAERGEKGLETAEAQRWYGRLHVEEANFYAALDWCWQQAGEAESGLTLAGALWHYWHVRGIVWEGRRWLTLFLERAEARPTFERARALNGAGMLAYRQGDYPEVAWLCGEALAISKSLIESQGESEERDLAAAFALHYLGHVAQEQGKMAEAEDMLYQSLDLYCALHNEWGYAETLNCLGDLHRQLGSYGDAAQKLETALQVRRKLKDRRGISASLHNLGHALCRQNDPKAATACFHESLEISQALNNKPMSIMCILGFAHAAGVEGKPERSALLLSAASHLLEAVGYRLEPPERADYEWLVAHLHTLLDEKSYQALWEEGASMSLAEAMAAL